MREIHSQLQGQPLSQHPYIWLLCLCPSPHKTKASSMICSPQSTPRSSGLCRMHLLNLLGLEWRQSWLCYTWQFPTVPSLPNVLFLYPGSTGARQSLAPQNCLDSEWHIRYPQTYEQFSWQLPPMALRMRSNPSFPCSGKQILPQKAVALSLSASSYIRVWVVALVLPPSFS